MRNISGRGLALRRTGRPFSPCAATTITGATAVCRGSAWKKIGGVKVHLEHGHRRGLQALRYLALEEGARIALFGHTHYPYCEENGGVLLLNPGSAGNYCRGGRARAALLEIDGESVSVKQYML